MPDARIVDGSDVVGVLQLAPLTNQNRRGAYCAFRVNQAHVVRDGAYVLFAQPPLCILYNRAVGSSCNPEWDLLIPVATSHTGAGAARVPPDHTSGEEPVYEGTRIPRSY